ncbi:MAG: hypothetical protein KKB30_07670 [Proteobacteria bacterium]|nr:hypothetical protein [Pseudomonadota bacterium]MBU1715855.1 hypothetical protein [Pseudomonadota bacterium]
MEITLFKSSFCPRCRFVSRALSRLRNKFPNLEIKTVDVATNPLKTWQAGVRMIPALQIEDKILSGIFLTRGQIIEFISLYYKDNVK